MAQFRATIQGQRGEASRLGSKNSGIEARVNGWNAGILVEGGHMDGKDVFRVYRTAGSGGFGATELIATIVEGDE